MPNQKSWNENEEEMAVGSQNCRTSWDWSELTDYIKYYLQLSAQHMVNQSFQTLFSIQKYWIWCKSSVNQILPLSMGHHIVVEKMAFLKPRTLHKYSATSYLILHSQQTSNTCRLESCTKEKNKDYVVPIPRAQNINNQSNDKN